MAFWIAIWYFNMRHLPAYRDPCTCMACEVPVSSSGSYQAPSGVRGSRLSVVDFSTNRRDGGQELL
jgi:hypothetical protein